MIETRLPKVTLGAMGLVLLFVAILLFLLGRGRYGAGEEKPMSRNEIQQSAPSLTVTRAKTAQPSQMANSATTTAQTVSDRPEVSFANER